MMLVENDTIIGFNKDQAYILEGYRLDLEFSYEISKNLLSKIDDCEELNNVKDKTILKYDKLISEFEELNKINDNIIKAKDKTIKRQSNAMKIGGISIAVGIIGLLLLAN